MKLSENRYDVIIAGAGPAGTSAAIHLANHGVSVLLAEQKQFPRPKLCGEFISPECWNHFERLGVADRMTRSNGTALKQTVFYARRGHSVTVPSKWFGAEANALGLSRAEMDNNLLQRARDCGVTILEDAQACGLVMRRSVVRGVTIRSNASRSNATQVDYFADINIDATGRSRVLARRFDAKARRRRKPGLVAFKAHLQNARVAAGACEIYFYPGGYGGLNAIEGGKSNLCFIVAARDARRFQSDPERLMRELVCKNARAAQTLEGAETASPWLSVALEGFGRRKLIPAAGLLTAGDAASFIDPFTGSGMLMALEGGELAAETIILHQNKPAEDQTFSLLATKYRTAYAKKFSSRLRTAGFLRRAAFIPQLAEAAILFFGSDWLRQRMARATRAGSNRAVEGAADQKLTI